jgi:hypothetical protein
MSDDKNFPSSYQCVQPELGDQIWQLEIDTTAEELQTRLRHHLTVCDSCRLTLAVSSLIEETGHKRPLDFGADALPVVPEAGKRSRLMAVSGGLALAASLSLALLLPPGQLERSLVRGPSIPEFVTPVEGEILLQKTPKLSWTPVSGATAYRIQVSGVGNNYQWTAESSTHFVAIPSNSPLPLGEEIRVVVQPVPLDLVPMGSISVNFHRESPGRFLTYRARSAPAPVKILGLFGLGALILGLAQWHRRPKHLI